MVSVAQRKACGVTGEDFSQQRRNGMLKNIITFGLIIICTLVIMAISLVCSPTAQLSTIDELGCPKPAPSVFTQSGFDATVGSSTFGKVITGNVALKISTSVTDLMSKAARNEELIAWLICRDQKNGLIQTPEQLQNAKNAARFYSLSPTPEQALSWHKENPFPSGSTIRVTGRVLGKAGEPISGGKIRIAYQGKTIAEGEPAADGSIVASIPINYHDTDLEITYLLPGYSVSTPITFHAIAPSVVLKPFSPFGIK